MRRTTSLALAATIFLSTTALLAPTSARAGDILQLKDGRFVEGVPLAIEGEQVVLKYENHPVRLDMERLMAHGFPSGPVFLQVLRM